MSKNINVKYGIEILIITLLPLIFIISEIIKNGNFSGIWVVILYAAILGFAFLGISYKMENAVLIITNCFFWKTRIPIEEIYKIENTWNMIAAPAPSIAGRIEIYWTNKSIVISPKFQDELKTELLRINPTINFK